MSHIGVIVTRWPVASLHPVVSVGYAAFAGNSTSPAGMTNSNVTFFGGIPYAQPPVRELRWRAPKKLDETSVDEPVVTDARNWGPPCLQWPANVGIGTEGMALKTPAVSSCSEFILPDCLTLNIWKPTNATEDSHLPVAVYIHVGFLSVYQSFVP
jgi:carboxylesterase type B